LVWFILKLVFSECFNFKCADLYTGRSAKFSTFDKHLLEVTWRKNSL